MVPSAAGTDGWLPMNRSSLVGLAAPGPLSAIARNRSRSSAPVETGKNFSELMTRSMSLPSAR